MAVHPLPTPCARRGLWQSRGMKRSLALLLVTVAFVAAGCSGSSSDADAGPTTTDAATASTTLEAGAIPTMPPGGEVDIDPCTLLTLDEASAEFGAPLVENDLGDQFPMVCSYIRGADTDAGNPADGVRLEIQSADVYDHAKAAQEANAEMGIVMTPVDGIGDDAYLQQTGPTLQLGFRTGDIAVYVKVDDVASSDEDRIAAMETLAAIIVERI